MKENLQFKLAGKLVENLSLVFSVLAIFCATNVFAIEVNPGQDSTYCSGSTFKLGGDPTAKEGFPPYKYEWTFDNDSLTISSETDANPTVTIPKGMSNNVVVFTLKVTDSEGFECTEEVTITIVDLGDIEFSAPFLPLNESSVTASLPNAPPGVTIVWEIDPDENEPGCTIHPETGVITSGNTSGKIRVIASIQSADNTFSCETSAELCIDNEPCCEVTGTRKFGPVTIEFADGEINEKEVTPDGYCVYEDIPAKIGLKLAGQTQYQDSFELPDVSLSWEEKTVDDELVYRNVKIEWANEDGISLTEKIADRINVKITQASLMINAEGQLTGLLTFQASLTEDVNLFADRVYLRQGLTGTFTYSYMASAPFSGVFDLSGIENIAIDFERKNANGTLTTLASIQDATLNAEGQLLNANFVLDTDEALPIFDINSFKVEFLAFNMVFDLDIFLLEITEFISGNVKFKVFDIENVDGHLLFDLTYANQTFTGNGTLVDVTAFGMEINGTGQIELTDSLSITSISLINVSAQHQQFDQAITNINMKVELGKLVEFSADAVTLKYNNGVTFEVADISYANDSLLFNAKVIVANVLELEVIGFRVSTDGSVSIKEINGKIEKAPIYADVKAAFHDTYFEGSFNATLLQVLGGGATIQIQATVGTASDGLGGTFNYGFFAMSANTSGPQGIPLGTTGLKITGLGGQFGYNWFIPPITEGQSSIPDGIPQQGALTLGLSITVGDLANNFAVTLAAAVSWGVENLTFMAGADLKVPPNPPNHYVDASVQFQFNLNTGELKGPLAGQVKVPQTNGKLFNLNGALFFEVGNSQWQLVKNADQTIGGTIFEVVTVNVSTFEFKGPLGSMATSQNVSGKFAGTFNYTFPNVEIKFPSGFDATNCITAGNTSYAGTSYTTGFGFAGTLSSSISGALNTNFENNNFTGAVEFNLNASANFLVAWPGWTCSTVGPLPSYGVVLNGNLKIELIGANTVNVSGDVNISSGSLSANASVEFTLQ